MCDPYHVGSGTGGKTIYIKMICLGLPTFSDQLSSKLVYNSDQMHDMCISGWMNYKQ